jgi:hypothetical protein
MTIPEISPLLLLSMCGLSFVCVGSMLVVGLLTVRFVFRDVWDFGMGLLGRDEPEPATATAGAQAAPVATRRDLKSRAQSFDFDAAVGGGGGQTAPPSLPGTSSGNPRPYGENPSLRPDGRPRFSEKARDWNLAPPGRMSDDPRNMQAPPPPDFNPNNEYLPNERSNIGGRVGRHNTGRGQSGQRMDASGSATPPKFDSSYRRGSLRADRNVRRDDEFFGGQADFDGDGDPDI